MWSRCGHSHYQEITIISRSSKISFSIANTYCHFIWIFSNNASPPFSLAASVTVGDTGSLKPWQQCFPSNYCNTGPCKPPQGSIKPDTRSSARIWNGLRGSIIKCNLEKKYEKKPNKTWSVKTREVNQGNKWALRMNLWASCDLRKDKSTLIFGKTFGQVSSKTWAPGGKKSQQTPNKGNCFLSF